MSVRLIDANKIFPWYLKAFSVEEAGKERAIGPDEVRFSMNDIRENLDNIPTECEWIPCSKQLPEEDGEYLVTTKWQNGYLNVDILNFANDLNAINKYDFPDEECYGRSGWYECDSEYGDYEIDDVIAWMPLPEPY